jgi:hypothetical protein
MQIDKCRRVQAVQRCIGGTGATVMGLTSCYGPSTKPPPSIAEQRESSPPDERGRRGLQEQANPPSPSSYREEYKQKRALMLTTRVWVSLEPYAQARTWGGVHKRCECPKTMRHACLQVRAERQTSMRPALPPSDLIKPLPSTEESDTSSSSSYRRVLALPTQAESAES